MPAGPETLVNLLYYGSLYDSFMFFNTIILKLPVPIMHLPINGNESVENMVEYIETFGAIVLLSNVSTTRRIAGLFADLE